jgi:hypothetical protein
MRVTGWVMVRVLRVWVWVWVDEDMDTPSPSPTHTHTLELYSPSTLTLWILEMKGLNLTDVTVSSIKYEMELYFTSEKKIITYTHLCIHIYVSRLKKRRKNQGVIMM